MNISVRLFLGFFLIVGLAVWAIIDSFTHETEPGFRQATEETLVDTAHVLAELAAPELAADKIGTGPFAAALRAARQRSPGADIAGVSKEKIDFRVFVMDSNGRVVYDSAHAAVGEDYSRWRDVARVLRGEYGARSTREDPYDPGSTVMYVAAPIFWQGERIGVLSLAKPQSSLQPYIANAWQHARHNALLLLFVTVAIGLLFTAWLTFTIERLKRYAVAVSEGRKAAPPTGGGQQFSELARALAVMREKLEGKQYVEQYVQNLAHEMKSPLTAILGAAEILEGEESLEARRHFATSIGQQSRRLQAIIERMLSLARVEQLQVPEARQDIELGALIRDCLAQRALPMMHKQLDCQLGAPTPITVAGDVLLIQQALLNLLDNAIDFSPPGSLIEIRLDGRDGLADIRIRDHGPGAPDYALPRLFERFYSLPRPGGNPKSTGLGLAFVREVARLHNGDASFCNHPEGGAEISLTIAMQMPP